jgi:methionyl aminopeptidase
LNGWCADRAISLVVGTVRPEWLRLLKVGEETLRIAITEMPKSKRWSEVARKMQAHVERAGFSVVTQYVGHGIGRIMHENPQVPNFISTDSRKSDFKLEPGLVLAIEPMVNMGLADVETRRDHWTVVTTDGLPSVHIEHTVALTDQGAYIITADDDSQTILPATAAAVGQPGLA